MTGQEIFPYFILCIPLVSFVNMFWLPGSLLVGTEAMKSRGQYSLMWSLLITKSCITWCISTCGTCRACLRLLWSTVGRGSPVGHLLHLYSCIAGPWPPCFSSCWWDKSDICQAHICTSDAWSLLWLDHYLIWNLIGSLCCLLKPI
jgi:hypothetical protein